MQKDQWRMNSVSVRDFGATGDGVTMDTEAIQAAIDACSGMGGGTVYVPPGDFVTGTITLKDYVTLHVGPSARLLGSTDLAHYPDLGRVDTIPDYPEHLNFCLINAYQAHHISFTGQGCIDGRGAAFPAGTEGFNVESEAAAPSARAFVRPTLLHFTDCHDVTIGNLTLKDAPAWCCQLEKCREMRIHGVRIFNRANQNNDGFDLTDCEDVLISDCHIDSGDDAIAVKTGGRRIAVTNCVISTRWAAIRIGPESLGEFRDIAVSNCVIHDTYGSAIKIQEVEGGVMENMSFDNLVMENVTGPISLRLGGYLGWRQERAESRPIGVLRNIRFSNIQATVADNAYPLPHEVPPFPGERKSCLNITGVPGHVVENVSFSGLRISFPGGGTQEDAQRTVPEMRDHYPEYHMFGTLPAYGAYLRHVRGAIFENVTIEFGEPDLRPAIVGEDVEELELANVRADGATEAALISLRDARQVYVHGCRPLREVALFLRVEGAGSENILLQANDLRRAKQDCLVVEGASAEAVTLA
jgi:hypothetical protein